MPNTINVGGIRGTISAEDTKFQAAAKRTAGAWKKQRDEMRRTQRRAQQLNRTFGRLRSGLAGLAAGAGFAALAQSTAKASREMANYGSGLVEVSQRLGTTVEDLQVLRRVFEGDGVAAQKFDQIMTALVRRFSANSPTLQKAIQKVGISLDEWYATGGDIAKLLPLIAKGMAQSTSQADRLNLAQEAFSASGRAAAVILQQGPAAMARNADAMRELGIVTQGEAQALKDYGQELANLRTKELTAQAKSIAGNTQLYLDQQTAISNVKIAFSEMLQALTPVLKALVGIWETMKLIAPGRAAKAAGDALAAQRREAEAARRAAEEAAKVAGQYSGANAIRITPKIEYRGIADYDAGLSDEMYLAHLEAVRQAGEATDAFLKKQHDAANMVDQDWANAWKNVSSTAATAIGQMVTGFQSLESTVRSVIASIIAEMVRISVVKPIAATLGASFGLPGFAASGGYHQGLTWVGERGPELVDFGASGAMVYNAMDSQRMAGGQSLTVNMGGINVGSVPGETSMETERRLLAAVDERITKSWRDVTRGSAQRQLLRRSR